MPFPPLFILFLFFSTFSKNGWKVPGFKEYKMNYARSPPNGSSKSTHLSRVLVIHNFFVRLALGRTQRARRWSSTETSNIYKSLKILSPWNVHWKEIFQIHFCQLFKHYRNSKVLLLSSESLDSTRSDFRSFHFMRYFSNFSREQ